MKLIVWAVISFCLLFSTPAMAVAGTVTDPNAPLALESKSVIVSAFSGDQTLDFVELFNRSNHAVDVSGWEVVIVTADEATGSVSEAIIGVPSGWLVSGGYLTLGRVGLVTGADATYDFAVLATDKLTAIELRSGDGEMVHDVTMSSAFSPSKWYQRKTGSSGLNGVFEDFTAKTGTAALRGGGLYSLPPVLAGVKIVELHPRPADCSPLETSLLCRDYIKIYNELETTVDLTSYRLKTDSGTSTSGNTFHLGLIGPKSYLTVWQRDNGAQLSLTNDGGYAWFEDVAGIQRYDDTMVGWPDASATSRQGQAWSQDGEGDWRWTATPNPVGENLFPVEPKVLAVSSGLAPCPAGKYRSLETNRCRTVEEAIAVLAACDVGQVRNPQTNRCRKVATATASLTPCGPGQERNPATNRCRAIAAAADQPKPCPAGQERNPATNRCRAAVSSQTPATFTDPKDSESNGQINLTLVAGIFAVAIGYALYEWRREMAQGMAWVVAKLKH